MGRPPTGRTETLFVRLTPAELEEVRRRAAAAELDVPDWVRRELCGSPAGDAAKRGPRREPASVPGELAVGDYVQYMHPDWGHRCGRVLRLDGEPGKILVQDQAPTGAREWWPLADCVRVDDP